MNSFLLHALHLARLISISTVIFLIIFINLVTSISASESTFSVIQKQELNQLIEQYLNENPEVIVKAIQQMQERQSREDAARSAEALKKNKKELITDQDAPVIGNLRAKVTVVEFFDYRCGYCKRAFNIMMKVLKENPDIRYVLKELPILGPDSINATRASLAIWRTQQDKYLAFHSALMKARGGIPESKIFNIAAEIGIDIVKLKKDMADPKIDQILEKNFQLAQALNITGTPAFIIGDQIIPGAIDEATMKKMIAATDG